MCIEFGGEMSWCGSLEEKYNTTCGMTLCSLVIGYPTFLRNLLFASAMAMETAGSADILVYTHVTRGLGWRSGSGTALLVGGSRDRSPVTGDFFPGHQTVPCALGSTQSLKMVPGYSWG